MKQYEQVINAMEENDGYATLSFLYQNVDVSKWGTKTHYASIRQIVQTKEFFFKIKPGLWGLKNIESKVLKKLNIDESNKNKTEKFNHSYFQGLLVEIGNMEGYKTYIPPQDKNKLFLEKKLGSLVTTDKIFNFSYDNIIAKAKTVDVIWFNDRKMPAYFFEVEHTTDMQNSISKFYELQDFYSKFYIVSDITRKREFNSKINNSIFEKIKNRIEFYDYEHVNELHTKTFEYSLIKKL